MNVGFFKDNDNIGFEISEKKNSRKRKVSVLYVLRMVKLCLKNIRKTPFLWFCMFGQKVKFVHHVILVKFEAAYEVSPTCILCFVRVL